MTKGLSNKSRFHVPKHLASCIDRLGTGEFYASFFQMMKTIARIDQYMVFEFSPAGDYATCRLAHNRVSSALGVELASRYLEGAYLDDPLLASLKASLLQQAEEIPCRFLEKRELPVVYRKRFFNVPNFETKFSFVVVDRKTKHLFYINFYNKKANTFSENQHATFLALSPTIGALLLKHFRAERKQRGTINSLLASGLSEREAQTCQMLLQGHTAKSIGNHLNLNETTIITYKKRAFRKLNISRKSELVKFV